MRYTDETEEYVQFGSRRNMLLLKTMGEIAKRHDIHWKLHTEMANGFSLEMVDYKSKTSHTIRPDALGKVLERALTVLRNWTGESYDYRRKCTFYGLDAHTHVIQWLNGRDHLSGRWVPQGGTWEDGPDICIIVSHRALLEHHVSGEIYIQRPSLMNERLVVTSPFVDGEDWEVPDGTLFYSHSNILG